jgi:Transcription factor WhiB
MTTRWADEARCREIGSEFFFYPKGGEGVALAKVAKSICSECLVIDHCFEFVMRMEESQNDRHGVWAGLTPKERSRIASRQEVA